VIYRAYICTASQWFGKKARLGDVSEKYSSDVFFICIF